MEWTQVCGGIGSAKADPKGGVVVNYLEGWGEVPPRMFHPRCTNSGSRHVPGDRSFCVEIPSVFVPAFKVWVSGEDNPPFEGEALLLKQRLDEERIEAAWEAAIEEEEARRRKAAEEAARKAAREEFSRKYAWVVPMLIEFWTNRGFGVVHQGVTEWRHEAILLGWYPGEETPLLFKEEGYDGYTNRTSVSEDMVVVIETAPGLIRVESGHGIPGDNIRGYLEEWGTWPEGKKVPHFAGQSYSSQDQYFQLLVEFERLIK